MKNRSNGGDRNTDPIYVVTIRNIASIVPSKPNCITLDFQYIYLFNLEASGIASSKALVGHTLREGMGS